MIRRQGQIEKEHTSYVVYRMIILNRIFKPWYIVGGSSCRSMFLFTKVFGM